MQGRMMQRQFALDDEHQPIAISLPEDSLISVQTSSDYLRPPKQEDCCEENAFCIYPIVQTVRLITNTLEALGQRSFLNSFDSLQLIGIVDLGAFYLQLKLIKANNELQPEVSQSGSWSP